MKGKEGVETCAIGWPLDNGAVGCTIVLRLGASAKARPHTHEVGTVGMVEDAAWNLVGVRNTMKISWILHWLHLIEERPWVLQQSMHQKGKNASYCRQ